MAVKETWRKVTSIFAPRHLITFAYNVSDKESIAANFYCKSAEEIHELGAEMRQLADKADAHFKEKLEAAKAAVDAELAKNEEGNK